MTASLRLEAEVRATEAHLGYWLRFIGSHVSHCLRLRLERQGVTVSEWLLLREIYRLGPQSRPVLAHRLGMTRSAVSKLIGRLQSKYLIDSAGTTAGARNSVVALTTVGRALVPTLAAIAEEVEKEFFGHMARAHREELTRSMKLIARLHRLKPIPVE
jgi:MarR family transcriptional regulator, temperature-dependent positive regulator of motility